MSHRNDKDRHSAYDHIRRTPLLDLFPSITPFSTGFLEVDDGHELYWEQSGNPDGIPIVLLHGGPGAGTSPVHRRLFDPDHYRIILYDQRGAGKSTPLGTVENNTLDHLVQDMETLRRHLSIDKWHIFGGSWGSTLALAYASKHPDKCISLILRGIFLLEDYDINWFLYGIKTIFPEAWEQFSGLIPEDEQDDLLTAYHNRLMSADPNTQIEAAINWTLYESACSSLIPNYEIITTQEQKDRALSLARLECHYFKTQMIASENSLLNNIDTFRSIPSIIIQGRYDIICPIMTAHKLHTLWPEADYIVVPDGGHSALDPAIRSRLIEATENAKTL